MKALARCLAPILLLLPMLQAAASAQPDDLGFDEPAVTVTAAPRHDRVGRGEIVPIAVILDHAPGYHTWPNVPVVPPDFKGLSPIATTIDVIAPLPVQVGAILDTVWPEPSPVPVASPAGGTVDLLSFHHRAVAYIIVQISPQAPMGRFELPLLVGYQACNEVGCLAPEETEVRIALEVTGAQPALFSGLDLDRYSSLPEVVASGGRDKVKVRALARWSRVAPGADQVIAVEFTTADGFHIWPDVPVVPREFSGLTPIPTQVTPPAAAPWLASAGTDFPEPSPVPVRAPNGKPVEILSYHDRAIAFVRLRIDESAPPGRVTAPLSIRFQACDDRVCLPPESVTLEIEFDIGPGDPIPAPGVDPAMFDSNGTAPTTETTDAGPTTTTSEAAPQDISESRKFLGFVPVPEGGSIVTLLAVSVLGFFGGMVLNLTPCVLPMIPIKIMTLTKHAGSTERTFFLGAIMALGVVAFWVGISIPVIIWQSFGDPSQLFGYWWFSAGMGIIIVALSFGLMGMFSINLPQKLYFINPKADSVQGSFLFGIMTGVLGLPCFGFIAGALLAAIASQPRFMTLAVFTSIGIGMAAPYLVLAARPSLLSRIPRTGPASELVKQYLGILMIGAGAYFVGSGLTGLTAEMPAVGESLVWWIVAVFIVLAGLWLAWRTLIITRSPGKRVVFIALGLLLGAGSVAWAVDRTRQAELDAELWHEFDPVAFARARAEGKTIVLDFTATWCLNCQTLKATVLDRRDVRSAMLGDNIVAFEADLTSKSAPGWEALKSLGETGIPMLAVFGPGLEEPWKSNAYGPGQVKSAIKRASGR